MTVLRFGYHPRPKRQNIRDPRIGAAYDQLEARFDAYAGVADPQGDSFAVPRAAERG